MGSTQQPSRKKGLPRQSPHASHQVEQGRQERALHPSSAPWCLEAARQENGRTAAAVQPGGIWRSDVMCEQMGLDRLPLGCVDLEQGASSFRAILSYTLLFIYC